jgi:feruloyl esterase
LDEAQDGLVQNFTACTTEKVSPALAAITCGGPKTPSCVSSLQVAALGKVFGGARTSKGERLYAPWAWDAGIGGKTGAAYNPGWRSWKLGAAAAPTNSAINLTLGASALPSLFVTPPVAVSTNDGGAAAFALGFDIESAPRLLAAKTAVFREPALEYMKADATDLSKFRARGGKVILVHGVSDPVFSILDTVDWWQSVDRVNRGRAADFVRLFAVPGMNHCGGGPSTDQFDAFTALVNWTEKGIVPDRIIATARTTTPWPGRTRPLCAYPKQARYKGTGGLEDADNFVCQ